jgi:mannose-6-phosphate isomerase-like protein (cupin superfamily)
MKSVALFIVFILMYPSPGFSQSDQVGKTEQMLKTFTEDYQKDGTLTEDISFGIKVGDDFWHVTAKAKTDTSDAKVELFKGAPAEPSFYFKTDFETLVKIYNGELNALTGSAKAFETDFAPFDADVMEGFQPDETFVPKLLKTLFHFWTKGRPEIIPYGIDYTRMTHGAQASIFYYQPGFRSAYIAIKKGQHANKDEKSKSNPFPTLVIAIKGESEMIIDGKNTVLKGGNAVFIPANVTHEFMNSHDEPFEGILLMVGDGA